jgi:lipoate-protein ligase A
MTAKTLRIIDLGTVGAARSQALWHGIASAMTDDSRPTLSLCHPLDSYVGLGYHRSLAEIDHERCRLVGLPILRRRIGGGPVYIDNDQLFFQLSLPAALAPRRVDLLYRRYLDPAVAAFRRLGLPAELRGVNDIAVADRKISGTGAGRIGDGVTVVGNVIFDFPHRRMADVLALPSERSREQYLRLIKRHLSSLRGEGLGHISRNDATEALVDCYADALGSAPEAQEPTPSETREMERWERRLRDPAWLAGPPVPDRHERHVKVSSDAWLWIAGNSDLRLEAALALGRVEGFAVDSRRLNGEGTSIREKLLGMPADPARIAATLADFGELGREINTLLAPGLKLR